MSSSSVQPIEEMPLTLLCEDPVVLTVKSKSEFLTVMDEMKSWMYTPVKCQFPMTLKLIGFSTIPTDL